MAKVFLSYARDDSTRIEALVRVLERAGHSVWWDRHIRGGAEYADEIAAALESADAVVAAWSTVSVRSHWVRDEAAAGRERGRLVPVTLDGTPPPLGFRQLQTVDLTRWSGREDDPAVAQLLAALPGTRAETVPEASPPPPPRRRVRMWLPIAAASIALLAVAAALLLHQRGAGGVEVRLEGCSYAVTFPAPPGALDLDRPEVHARSAVQLSEYHGVEWRALCLQRPQVALRDAAEGIVAAATADRDQAGDRVLRSRTDDTALGPVGTVVHVSAPGQAEARRWYVDESGVLLLGVRGPIEAVEGPEATAFFDSVRRR